MAVPLGAFRPAHLVGVRGCPQLPAGHPAKIVGNHVVETDSLAVTVNALKQFHQLHRLHQQARLFMNLTRQPARKGLTQFKSTAGQRPLALQRLRAAAHQQHPAGIHNHRAHRHNRRCWKLSPHLVPS